MSQGDNYCHPMALIDRGHKVPFCGRRITSLLLAVAWTLARPGPPVQACLKLTF